MITSTDQLDFNKEYSYQDYLSWKFKERVELLRGRIFPVTKPSTLHQEISGNLHGFLWSHLRKSSCKVYTAPFDVKLPLPKKRATTENADTIVQPDLCVICDLDKIKAQICEGAPELIAEILSPGNSKKEMKNKFELYEEAGVQEYWIVDPIHQNVLVHRLNDAGKFESILPYLTDEDVLTSSLFPGLQIELSEVFPSEEV